MHLSRERVQHSCRYNVKCDVANLFKMSQTVDAPLKLISDSINGRDKLLKLAEVNNSKGKKKGLKLSLSSSKNADRDANYDLAFTTNIEHLVNKDYSLRASTPIQQFAEHLDHDQLNTSLGHDVNSNLSCDSACDCLTHSTSLNETHLAPCPSDLRFSDLKLYEPSSISSNREFKSRIPQSVNRKRLTKEIIHGLNRWPDNEDLSKHNNGLLLSSKLGSANASEADYHLSSSKSSISDNHFGLTCNQSRIPIHKSNVLHKLPLFDDHNNPSNILTNTHLYNSQERRFFRTNSFISYLSDNNRKPSQLGLQVIKCQSDRNSNYQQNTLKLSQPTTKQSNNWPQHSSMSGESNHSKVVKSRSHNALHHRCSKEVSPGQTMPCQAFTTTFSDCFGADLTETTNRLGENVILTDSTKQANSALTFNPSNIHREMNRIDSFFVIDEDCFANSPKKLVNQKIQDHFMNAASSVRNKVSQLVSTPDQKLYEKQFLQESQKNSLFFLNLKSEHVDTKQVDTFAKSNSCGSLDYFQYGALSKPKSETDITDTKTNDLSGLMHLEEDTQEGSMFNRFKKTFSLRFSKHWSSSNKESLEASAKDTALTSDSNLVISEESHSPNQSDVSDINQNRIFKSRYFESDSMIGKMSTIERRKSRADMFNRKSFRRKSRKSLRLKRSHSQPNDKSSDQISPSTDRSVDSDLDANKWNNSQGDTKSSNELDDSQEVSGALGLIASLSDAYDYAEQRRCGLCGSHLGLLEQ